MSEFVRQKLKEISVSVYVSLFLYHAIVVYEYHHHTSSLLQFQPAVKTISILPRGDITLETENSWQQKQHLAKKKNIPSDPCKYDKVDYTIKFFF